MDCYLHVVGEASLVIQLNLVLQEVPADVVLQKLSEMELLVLMELPVRQELRCLLALVALQEYLALVLMELGRLSQR
jgi:hypothetical protein